VAWDHGLPGFGPSGLTVQGQTVPWDLVGFAFLAVLALRVLVSPGQWMFDIHPVRIRGGCPEALGVGRRLVSGLLHYGVILALLGLSLD
jgi:hypothetical protein